MTITPELLDEIGATIKRFVIVPDSSVAAITLWAVLTYCYDSFGVCPILTILSPEKQCGKTTLMEMLMVLVTRCLPTSNCTSAVIFRSVEAFRPTLLIDEADSFMNDQDELRGILDSGHRKAFAFAIRTVGDEHKPAKFSTWCPKAFAAIGKLPDTLMDRSIVIHMRRKTAGESVERLRFERISDEMEPIRRKVARWVQDNHMTIALSDPVGPDSLDDRAQDNWRPLLSIAAAAGGRWPELARQSAIKLSGRRAEVDESARTMLLVDIQAIFNCHGVDRIASDEIVADLVEREDRPWPEWKKGKPITTTQIARLLKPFDIKPKVLRLPSKQARGYELEDFNDAFSRYLPSPTVPPSQANKDRGQSDFSTVPQGGNGTDGIPAKSNKTNDGTAGTVGNPGPWRERV